MDHLKSPGFQAILLYYTNKMGSETGGALEFVEPSKGKQIHL